MDHHELDLQQHLNHLWDRLKHENEMIDDRLSGLWTLQGLLLVSFGLLSSQMNMGKMPISIICFIGLCSCFSIGYSVHKGQQVLDALRTMVKDVANQIESGLALTPTHDPAQDTLAFFHPWRFLPWLLCLAWLALLWWTHT